MSPEVLSHPAFRIPYSLFPCFVRASDYADWTMPLRILLVAARTQLRIARRNIENIYPLLTIPLQSLISLAIIVHSGRPDLARYSLVASLLMTVGQMSFFDASEILAQDRNHQILELAVASPTAYTWPLIARILVLTSMGIGGFAESWLMARFV